jgi:hypothetical protein
MSGSGPYALFAALIAAGIIIEVVAQSRSRRRIRQWAAANGYVTQDLERDWFSLNAGRTFRVFHVTVLDSKGERRTAIWKIGGGVGGIAADDYEVKWSAEPAER